VKKGNVNVRYFLFFFFLPVFVMARRTSVGMGHRHSEMNRRLQTTSASNILTRLASRSINGHTLPIQVHQHYGEEFHLVLTDDSSCIRRVCYTGKDTFAICTQLERQLEGLCSCMFAQDRVLPLSYKVEQCFRAHPVPDRFRIPCSDDECDFCVMMKPLQRWIAKNKQAALHTQREICCCRCNYKEMIV